MRKAFKIEKDAKKDGKLTDSNQLVVEQAAIGHLFDSAIDYCRNPLGNREANLLAEGVVELIFFASPPPD